MVPRHTTVVVGNDATFAGLAEARRGAATDASVVLHLMVEVGIGGVLIVHRQPMTGAMGAGGEIGHLPFGDPVRRCPCGAAGCWDMEVDGRALARYLGHPPPRNPRAAADRVVAAARTGDDAALRAVSTVAAALGRGIGGLVNALDPAAVTVSGLTIDLLEVAEGAFERAYDRALMAYRRRSPPQVRCATVADGSLVGAAEAAFDVVLAEPGLTDWVVTRTGVKSRRDRPSVPSG
jgi:predicted NBD/HSP70 family sugar kinase